VLLVIEITTSPNASDEELERKHATYARVGIADYWLVPYGRPETVAALAVDDLTIGTDLLLQMSGKK
jgi:Uma2 family endonuclease